jgi:predicted  nucleic acid-binding Zn-ribbon protein
MEVLKKINELHDALVEKQKRLDAVAADQAEISSRILETSSALSAREQAIVGREHEVKKVEDVVALKAEALALMEKAKAGIADLQAQKQAWANEKVIQEAKLANDWAGIAQSSKNNEDNRLALVAKAKAIDAEVNKRVDAFLQKIKK